MSMIRIENWSVVPLEVNPYTAPELLRSGLRGKVQNHPNFAVNCTIHTSPIIGKRGDNIVTYSGSEYELGTVSEKYELRYPKARERLLKSLSEME